DWSSDVCSSDLSAPARSKSTQTCWRASPTKKNRRPCPCRRAGCRFRAANDVATSNAEQDKRPRELTRGLLLFTANPCDLKSQISDLRSLIRTRAPVSPRSRPQLQD